MTTYHFGELPGQPVGTPFDSRVAAKDARVHQVTQQGIAGNRDVGCASIVLSGGYDTDEDHGHEIFYTGAGGQDPNNPRGPHVEDQTLTRSDNAALVRSQETGLPIRIIRGARHPSPYSPSNGYRYDGLYKVVAHYPHTHPGDGYLRWIFHLQQLSPEEAAAYTPPENGEANARAYENHDLGSGLVSGSADAEPSRRAARPVDPYFDPAVEIVMPAGNAMPGTKVVVSQRVIRDTKVTAAVKALYANACQMCGVQVATKLGSYSEGAHIRPLGKPHHGPDVMSNILCLCPNHHAAFDKGGVFVDDRLNTRDATGVVVGSLRVHVDHVIDLNSVRYHRTHHGHNALIPG